METRMIFIYCLADSIVKALKLGEDPQSKMSLAEIITFAMISALFYQGNYQNDAFVQIFSKNLIP